MERRLHDRRVVEVLANVDYRIDSKDDFHLKENLEPVQAALQAAKIERNAEQLWETIFSTLMGEDVESRRKFIEENALDVRNLDV